MIYFLFFFIPLIISEDNDSKKDHLNTNQQDIENKQENKISIEETQDFQSLDPQQSISQQPHRSLRRIKNTRNFQKFKGSDDEVLTTVGAEKISKNIVPTSTAKPLKRRNAQINIPKITMESENGSNEDQSSEHSNDEQNESKETELNIQTDEEEDTFTNDQSISENEQAETENQSLKPTDLPVATPKPSDLPIATPKPTDLPIETPKPTDLPVATPKPTDLPVATHSKLPENENGYDELRHSDQKDDSELATKPKKKYPKFHIVSVTPSTLSSRGDEKLELRMNATLDGPPFIRFGDTIVHGRHSKKELTVKCRTPKLTEGEVLISVSIDKVKWCEPFKVVVFPDEGDLPWLFVLCAGSAIILVSVLISKVACGKRSVPKKKNKEQRREDIMNIMSANYSNNLHKRTKLPIEV